MEQYKRKDAHIIEFFHKFIWAVQGVFMEEKEVLEALVDGKLGKDEARLKLQGLKNNQDDMPVVDFQEIEPGIVCITMSDRENKNTFTDELTDGLISAFKRIECSESYKVAILTGYDSNFASGGTKDKLLAIQEGKIKFTDIPIYSLALECKIPVIAAMQGHGIGAGWSMGMFCDFIIFSQESTYTSNYMKYGFTPGAGATLVFPEKLGNALAQEILFTGKMYLGRELQERGIPYPVLKRKEVMPYAMQLARTLSLVPRGALVSLKEHLAAPIKKKLPDMYQKELLMHEKTFVNNKEIKQRIQFMYDKGTRKERITEKIAIIGMSGRFPGARTVEEFWNHIKNGRDCVTEVSEKRWPVEKYYDPDPEAPLKTYSKWMGELEDIDKFDPLFFNISPREAGLMDPQQRIFLESCWGCIEDAGIKPGSLSGTKCSVFAGCGTSDYDKLAGDSGLNAQGLMGSSAAILAAQISYLLNLKGPSLSIDTACSSSLVAIAQACSSLVLKTSDLALAGGVCVLPSPEMHIRTSKAGMLSPDGRCYTFDSRANGFVPGEGAGILLLKRYSDAVRDNDQIQGIICGWGINQDGKTNGITAPSGKSQAQLIKEVYEKFHVDPETISLVEAHGTGTKLGDPIEVEALADAFHAFTKKENFCSLGSVKTNIGHLLTASGAAGVIKVLLAMRHRMLPPIVNFKSINEHISLEHSPFYINQELKEWHVDKGCKRRACISAFGFSGTNAHIVLEEQDQVENHAAGKENIDSKVLILLSAKSKEQLKTYAKELKLYIESHEDICIRDIAYTLQNGRDAMEYRLAFQAESRETLLAGLEGYYSSIENKKTEGRVKKSNGTLTEGNYDKPEELIAKGLKDRDFTKLAEWWLQGNSINWNLLYVEENKPRKVSLPTYPFAREVCWFQKRENKAEDKRLEDREEIVVKQMAARESEWKKTVKLIPLVEIESGGNNSKVEDSAELEAIIKEELKESLSEILYIDSNRIETNKEFVELGLDSIIGVEWVRKLNQKYGTNYMATIVYEYPTIEKMAAFLTAYRCKLPSSVPGTVKKKTKVTLSALSKEPELQEEKQEEKQEEAEDYQEELSKSLSELLYIETSRIEKNREFVELGVDSIIGVEWVRQLNKKYETNYAATVLYEYPTIEKLSAFVAKDWKKKKMEQPAFKNEKTEASAEPSVSPSAKEAIAIIGISGRYPDSNNMEEYWDNLLAAENSIKVIPDTRWNTDTYNNNLKNKTGNIYCKWMGALEDIEYFDPLFFMIAPTEAELMDPQQRIFLQEAYHAFEDAGYHKETLENKKCGVYLGIMGNEYRSILQKNGVGTENITGNNNAIAAARISYFLNLKGPAIALDTACSSSLVTTHLACQALRSGEVDMALSGGVSLYLTPEAYSGMCSAGMLSAKGQCRTFDDSADGFVPGEGVGALVLKRLEDAEADRDYIYGVIIGSGINQDGKTNGITAPSMESQTKLVTEIYEKNKIRPDSISYVEMHGTGTKLGDPIELEALSRAFREKTKQTGYCAIGSVKSNIGHTSAAAGVAGIHKILLCMKNRKLVPTLNFREPNKHFNFENSPFYVNTLAKPWETANHMPLRAGVSSFGFSGTNAHIVIEEYAENRDFESQEEFLFVLSAKSREQLKTYAVHMENYIGSNTKLNLHDMAYTLQTGREQMEMRLAFVSDSKADLLRKLKNFQMESPDQDNESEVSEIECDQMLNTWIQEKNLHPIAGAWRRGRQIDFHLLHKNTKRYKVSLPAYPFAKEPYWVTENLESDTVLNCNVSRPLLLHPLVHTNISGIDGFCFYSDFTGFEPFLHENVMNGQRIFPGMVCLEMAAAAAGLFTGNRRNTAERIKIKKIVWAQPIACQEQNLQLFISLYPQMDQTLKYEIYREGAKEAEIHHQGVIETVQATEALYLNLEHKKQDCSRIVMTGRQYYGELHTTGMEYGEYYHSLDEIYIGQNELLAQLTWKHAPEKPGIMVSVQQAALCLLANSGYGQVACPLALDELELFGEMETECFIYVKLEGKSDRYQLDIQICNHQGKVFMQMRGLKLLFMKEAESCETFLLSPSWIENHTEKDSFAHQSTKRIAVFCDIESVHEEQMISDGTREIVLKAPGLEISEKYLYYSQRIFRELQTVLRNKPVKKVLFQVLIPNEGKGRLLAGLAGLLKTAHLENPNLSGQLIEIGSGERIEVIKERIKESSASLNAGRICYQNGKQMVIQWNRIIGESIRKQSIWKDKGVYLITGGTGSLGFKIAKEIAAKAKDVTLLLTGRSPFDSSKKFKIVELEEQNCRAEYWESDITSKTKTEGLIKNIIHNYGKLNGIIHCAGMKQDNFIIKKTEKELQEVMESKVKGVVNLDEASKELCLDSFLLFSSIAGIAGNIGQADYSAANAFMDCYSEYRNKLAAKGERHGHTLSINWPLWEDGGMQIDEQSEQAMQNRNGMILLEDSYALWALHQAFVLDGNQAAVFRGDYKKIMERVDLS